MNNAQGGNQEQNEWLFVQERAEWGSAVQTSEKINPKTLVLSEGKSLLFLANLVHAGACVQRGDPLMNYRIHAYMPRPNLGLKVGTTVYLIL